MPTALKQRAWEALGTALRSKGLGMVLAYWAQVHCLLMPD